MSKRRSEKRKKRASKRAKQDAARTEKTTSSRTWIPLLVAAGIVIAVAAYFITRPANSDNNKSVAANTQDESKSETVETKDEPDSKSTENVAEVSSQRRARPEYVLFRAPAYARSHSFNNETVLVWGGEHQLAQGLLQNSSLSNISRADYAGADSCRSCHAENYDRWAHHSHRWMNVLADEESVKGDFSGGDDAKINYWSGLGEFYRENGDYMMRLSRDGIERVFRINRTLGSRIHQYYVGVLVEGPEPEDHALRTKDHVLPFGYELTLKEWIPIAHASGQEGPDSARDDPFDVPSRLVYDKNCSVCHTTPTAGNLMLAMYKRFAAYTPRKLHFEGSNYIDKNHPGSVQLNLGPNERLEPDNVKYHINDLTSQAHELLTPENAVNLGIACEACHLGLKAHAENERIKPLFFPSGPYVYASGSSHEEIWGKTSANKNFICARCHSGSRPQYAAGMATWNSTEYTDAMRGHCYHEQKAEPLGMKSLTCVDCHNPHESIGRRWTKTAAQDNESCIRCHDKFREESELLKHTRHPLGSSGGDCMNCHMPKINEGMGDMVRTHTIFSPTNAKMLESNQPNACNMCHVQESIDWTLGYLRDWYGLTSREEGGTSNVYREASIAKNYTNRDKSVALGWLKSAHSGTRMVGSDVLIKAKAKWALPEILTMLDDQYMEVRQFTVQRLRDYMAINTDEFGYKLYMTERERRAPLSKMLEVLAPKSGE